MDAFYKFYQAANSNENKEDKLNLGESNTNYAEIKALIGNEINQKMTEDEIITAIKLNRYSSLHKETFYCCFFIFNKHFAQSGGQVFGVN